MDKKKCKSDIVDFLVYLESIDISELERIDTELILDYLAHMLNEFKGDETAIKDLMKSINDYLYFLGSTYSLFIQMKGETDIDDLEAIIRGYAHGKVVDKRELARFFTETSDSDNLLFVAKTKID